MLLLLNYMIIEGYLKIEQTKLNKIRDFTLCNDIFHLHKSKWMIYMIDVKIVVVCHVAKYNRN